jgi:MFS family permease
VQAADERSATTWADLLADGRLPRFALICLGVWLNAADSLVTATIMPSVGKELGGYGYFSWATAGYLVGAILAGASAGRLSEIFGLRRATALAGLVMVVGCVLSAAAPDVGLFLTGRLIQGLGSGWISGFAMVAIALLFPERHLARVFASVSGVWGIATVLGPLLGGIFAQSGHWRDVFWFFAAQTLAFSAAAPFLLKGSDKGAGGPGIPWLQLGVLGLGMTAVAVADVIHGVAVSLGLVALGLALLALVVWIDGRVRVRLLPHRAGDLRTVCGAGYASMFALTAASMGFIVYAPPLLQTLAGLSPLMAGYVSATDSLGWTLAAFAVASASGLWDARWVRIGAVSLILSLVILIWATPIANLPGVIIGGVLLGCAFGWSWSFMGRRVLAALSDEDRAIGSSAITAVRQTGAAVGAAISGAAANWAGFSSGLSEASAKATGVWIYAAVIPLGLVGVWAAFRLTGRAETAQAPIPT